MPGAEAGRTSASGWVRSVEVEALSADSGEQKPLSASGADWRLEQSIERSTATEAAMATPRGRLTRRLGIALAALSAASCARTACLLARWRGGGEAVGVLVAGADLRLAQTHLSHIAGETLASISERAATMLLWQAGTLQGDRVILGASDGQGICRPNQGDE